jgi:hypothetical protein
MNTTEQINALVERFGLSETVKQEIIKIVKQAFYNGRYTIHLSKHDLDNHNIKGFTND